MNSFFSNSRFILQTYKKLECPKVSELLEFILFLSLRRSSSGREIVMSPCGCCSNLVV
jgi:hypothetical protein